MKVLRAVARLVLCVATLSQQVAFAQGSAQSSSGSGGLELRYDSNARLFHWLRVGGNPVVRGGVPTREAFVAFVQGEAFATVMNNLGLSGRIEEARQLVRDGHFTEAKLLPNTHRSLFLKMGFDQGRKEKLNIVYMTAVSNRSISYIFTIYTDTFGAQGNLDFGTFTFDVKTGDRLKLGDIFMPGTNYLETLSLLSQSKLPAVIGQRADTSTINKGTAPEENNFERFFLDTKELVLLFPPYQVAAYSEGPQTLRIPLTELSSILKPEYR